MHFCIFCSNKPETRYYSSIIIFLVVGISPYTVDTVLKFSEKDFIKYRCIIILNNNNNNNFCCCCRCDGVGLVTALHSIKCSSEVILSKDRILPIPMIPKATPSFGTGTASYPNHSQ